MFSDDNDEDFIKKYYEDVEEDSDEDSDDEEVEESEEDSNEYEDEEPIDIMEYYGYPYAMEVVNGTVLSLTAEFQTAVCQRICEQLNVSQDELISYINDRCEDEWESDSGEEDREPESQFEDLDRYDYEVLSLALGYDEDTQSFIPEDRENCSEIGWGLNKLFEAFGYELEEDIRLRAHGHDTTGVQYISRF